MWAIGIASRGEMGSMELFDDENFDFNFDYDDQYDFRNLFLSNWGRYSSHTFRH
jgi:hypothetical protein